MAYRSIHISAAQRAQFVEEGWCTLPAVFSAAECDELIGRQTALREGTLPSPPPGFAPRGPNEWGRSMNQHVTDPMIQSWLVDKRLGDAMNDLLGEPVEGIQSMYFWRSDSFNGSPGQWHQDATPLPGCVATWIALEDANPGNGTIEFQAGSHAQRAIWHEDVLDDAGTSQYAVCRAATAGSLIMHFLMLRFVPQVSPHPYVPSSSLRSSQRTRQLGCKLSVSVRTKET
jgi:hypothetical protein